MFEHKIIWTKVDEAPELASHCLLPIIKSFTKGTGVEIESKDISLAARILANFPDNLQDEQKIPDSLAELGELAKTPYANIIKLPNISASVPQLQAAIKELKDQGFNIPNYPEDPQSPEDKRIQDRYSKVLGSAVNPVLREGNSDRRPSLSVKKFAQKYPHKMMKEWPKSGSKARVAYMQENDFYGSETSHTMQAAGTVNIEFVYKQDVKKILKTGIKLLKGEIIDSAVMNVKSLEEFYKTEFDKAKSEGTLISLHLKATMMKVSDPIMFGHAVYVYFKDVLDKYAEQLKEVGANVNFGLADVLDKLKKLPDETRMNIEKEINDVYTKNADLAMVDSRYGITNLHVPNNVIIDASMPNIIRDGGKMWNKDDKLQDTVAIIPDRCYATMYEVILEDAKKNGQFDPATMGSVANVGLMAQKAEEYGSHDKTFQACDDGQINIVDENGVILLSQKVSEGDIFRMCQTKDEPIKDWVKLAVNRAKASSSPAIFWLDENRSHDRELIVKVKQYLDELDTNGLEIQILAPEKAMMYTLERVRQGLNTISVTGNVLRDYLTDLFPILELGTSARMLSIVPLLNGGGLFETGAGGSAPKHVQQFLQENHLRWDSLGEYCALVPSLELLAEKTANNKAKILAEALDAAIGIYLENGKSPSRKVKEIDNRASSFYLALYWAQSLATQDKDTTISDRFTKIADALLENEKSILEEHINCQGAPVNIGGYYHSDQQLTKKAMRPSQVLNEIIDNL
ncbi:MAG TPA: NADP-dependent isocitrate dehydrogenase [Candidatus Kapabacteria bacterium]|nr:NADP-dependent isocitrate dehydrogenase [Candidatus Kapabacteria bacterium]